MSTTADNDHDNQVALESKLKEEQRLCHMVKRTDFDGYGFNLHSEKGKPGQYIGKIDEKSPAEQSGLRQGDRIIEVNGVNIGTETHKQVVQRIKAIENEVRLLVIDPEIEQRLKREHYQDGTMPTVAKTSESTSSQINNNNNRHSSKTSSPSATVPDDEQQINNNYNTRTSLTNSSESYSSSIDIAVSDSIERHDSTAPPSPSSSAPPKSSNIIENQSTKPSSIVNGSSNGTTTANSNGKSMPAAGPPPSSGLNLKMTAAEMRAKLQARKKYNPKNDSVDLRKKFDIIQKL